MIPNCCSCVRCQAIKMHLHLTEVVTGWPTQKIMKYFKLWEDEQVSSLLKPTLEKNQERTGIANAGWFIHKYAQMLKVVPHTAHLMTLFRSTSIKMQREILCLIIYFFLTQETSKENLIKAAETNVCNITLTDLFLNRQQTHYVLSVPLCLE